MKEVSVDRDYLETLTRRLNGLKKRVLAIENNSRPTLPFYDNNNWPPEAAEGQWVIGAPIIAKKVMNIDAADVGGISTDAYGVFSFSLPSELWLYFQVKVDQTLLDDISHTQAFTGNFAELGNAGVGADRIGLFTPDGGASWIWQTFTERPDLPVAQGDIWYTVEMHYVSSTTEWFVDGTSLGGPDAIFSPPSVPSIASPFIFGNIEAPGTSNPSGEFIHLRDIRIGTTRAETDIFVGDFSTGDLSQFTSLINDSKMTVSNT